jgi:hypothetical protein
MSDPVIKKPIPARAIASALFACVSVFLWLLVGQVHSVPIDFTGGDPEVLDRVVKRIIPIYQALNITYRSLAVLSLVWCIWSWRTEWWFAALTSTVFAGFAGLCFMVHI